MVHHPLGEMDISPRLHSCGDHPRWGNDVKAVASRPKKDFSYVFARDRQDDLADVPENSTSGLAETCRATTLFTHAAYPVQNASSSRNGFHRRLDDFTLHFANGHRGMAGQSFHLGPV